MRKSTKPHLSARVRLALLALPAAFASVALSSCNKHVFQVHPEECVAEENRAEPIDIEVPADILIVIDNSGSMCEEQANLVANFFDPACPITDLDNVDPRYKNPPPEMVATELASCGFVQLLAAYENDWRLGVITTDVGICDNRFGLAEAGVTCDGQPLEWGRRPQRGCLQPDANGKKVLQRGDPAVGESFRQILGNIQTFGSAFERGLDAVQVFLSPSSRRAPGCENDLNEFIREDAKLVVIFVTDEDDCSHADGASGFPDENEGEHCEGLDMQHAQLFRPADCYEKYDQLAPTTRYSTFLKNYKGRPDRVSAAVIAGAREVGGVLTPEGCTTDTDGLPAGGCWESGGNSNFTQEGGLCHPGTLANQGVFEPCCQADAGRRYFQFAQELGAGRFLSDSICYDSFRKTMLDIAAFIAAKDSVTLSEKPATPGGILVEITRAGEAERTTIDRIPDGEDPTGRDGWQYDGNRTITLYGTAKAGPGDTIHVAALANREGCGGAAEPDTDAGSN